MASVENIKMKINHCFKLSVTVTESQGDQINFV